MTRDWVLTLLAISPFLFAATIVVLGLTWQPIQNARARHAAKTSSPPPRADQMKEPSPTPLDVVAR